MRERSTWQNTETTSRQAATRRQADVYTLNQSHPQPSPTEYENGNPDTWAESQHGHGDIEAEYENGHVKRNEIGLPEFRDDTFNHKDSDNWHSGKGNYDNVKDGTGTFDNPVGKSVGEKAGRSFASVQPTDRRVAAENKAKAVERITRAMLRTSNDKLITDVAVGFMGLPDRSIVAALKALDSVSPDALPIENKTRRALACAKLAASLIGEVDEEKVTRLASTIMTLDDPTLKSIIRQVAAAHVAQQQEEQEEETTAKTGQEQEQEKVSQEVDAQQQVDAQQEKVCQEQQEGCDLPPAELAMLDQMLKEDMAKQGVPHTDDLNSLFQPTPVVTAPVVPAVVPAMASTTPEITFGDDEDGAPGIAGASDELDNLFADNEEVQAQRQIKAAEQEQLAREGGYNLSRTASTKGAKKIGNVQRTPSTGVDVALENLWDRP